LLGNILVVFAGEGLSMDCILPSHIHIMGGTLYSGPNEISNLKDKGLQ